MLLNEVPSLHTYELLLVALASQLYAYPPAPHHTIYGLVRFQNGEPITRDNVKIVFETSGGVTVDEKVTPGLRPGVNYRLMIPMDSMTGSDPYKDNALTRTVPFRIKVIDGTTTNLPIEMTGDFKRLGDPSKSTRIDLTLGADSDGDGLPDAWESILIAGLGGGGLAVTDINPNGDADGDGIPNGDEYIAGTYAFDPEDGFTLALKETKSDHVVLKFLAIKGRTYEIKRSTDLKAWEKVNFRALSSDDPSRKREWYSATDVRWVDVEVTNAVPSKAAYFYRGFVQ